MVPAIIDFARTAAADFGIKPARVLEVGSLDVNGSVREAFVGSVAWSFPPVKCQMSQLSTVPKASAPAEARRATPGT